MVALMIAFGEEVSPRPSFITSSTSSSYVGSMSSTIIPIRQEANHEPNIKIKHKEGIYLNKKTEEINYSPHCHTTNHKYTLMPQHCWA